MLETYTSLLNTTKKYLSIGASDTTKDAELVKELNNGRRFILTRLKNVGWIIQGDPDSILTEVDVDGYYYLPETRPPIEAATIDTNGRNTPLRVIDSQEEWNRLTALDTVAGSGTPSLILPKRDTFVLYPKPGAIYTVSLYSNPLYKDLANADYTTGTIKFTQNSTAVLGSVTTFTTAMANRWIRSDVEGIWYQIASVTDATHLTLKRKYVGVTGEGLAFTIGEAPNVPVELQELLPHYVVGKYQGSQLNDAAKAQRHLNFFWTGDWENVKRTIRIDQGGLLGALAGYSGRSEGAIVEKYLDGWDNIHEKWSITLN